jgi:hypothetical protein
VTVTELFPTRVSVTWPKPVDAISSQVWVSLYLNGSPIFIDRIGVTSATVDLTPGSAHQLQVTARDASRNVVAGDVLVVNSPAVTDFVPPSVPANLEVLPESYANEIILRWTQSTDNVDAQADIRYRVFLNGQLEYAAAAGGLVGVTCEWPGYTELFVQAVDTSGNVSAASNTVTFNCSP